MCGGGGGLASTASLRVGTQNYRPPVLCYHKPLSLPFPRWITAPCFQGIKGQPIVITVVTVACPQWTSIQFNSVHFYSQPHFEAKETYHFHLQRKHIIFTCKGNISFSLAKETYHFHLQRKHIIFTCPDTIILITVAKTLIIRGEKKVLQFRSQSGP